MEQKSKNQAIYEGAIQLMAAAIAHGDTFPGRTTVEWNAWCINKATDIYNRINND